MNRPLLPLVGVLLVALLASVSCDRATPAPPPDASEARIVSLVPAVTRILVDLDQRDRLVGLNQYDAYLTDDIPAVSSYPEVDIEKLLACKPTVVVVAKTKDSPSPRLVELARDEGYHLIALPYPDTVQAVADSIFAINAQGQHAGLGPELGLDEDARALRDRMLGQLNQLKQQTATLPAKRVLVCFGTSPVMASGPGTVNHDLLSFISATNAAGDAAVGAPTYDREKLLALKPDVVLILSPNAPPLTADDERLAAFAGLDIPAVANNQIHLINDPQCLMPGTNLPQVAAEMASLIHGKVFK